MPELVQTKSVGRVVAPWATKATEISTLLASRHVVRLQTLPLSALLKHMLDMWIRRTLAALALLPFVGPCRRARPLSPASTSELAEYTMGGLALKWRERRDTDGAAGVVQRELPWICV